MNWTLLANSLLVAGASTILALVIGFTVAAALAAAPRRLRRVFLAATIGVLALPSFLATNCWIDLCGTNGFLRPWLPINIFSPAGAVWILTLLLWPIPALGAWSAWQKLGPAHFETDAVMRGAKLIRHLLWPAAKSNFIVGGAITFALALNNFSVPAILQVKVFTSEIWVKFNTNLDALAALQASWPIVLAPLFLLLLVRRAEIPWPREMSGDTARCFRRQLGAAWLLLAFTITTLIVLLAWIAPLVQLTATSRTWNEFVPAFTASVPALANSLLYAAGAAVVALVLSLVLARMRAAGLLWFCFLVPGVLLGIGALTAFNRPGLDWFSRTAAIVIFVLVLRYMALAWSLIRVAQKSLDTTLLDSARLEGAGGLTIFRRIVLPQIAGPLAAAAYMVYVFCLWDVETILLVIPPGGETLALRIFNLLHYGHNAHVNALCMLLLLLALAPLLAWGMGQWLTQRLAGNPRLKDGA